jgi:FtsP/CotA-like multicopper oxidase with cupredoxin domain/peroxiredoxin
MRTMNRGRLTVRLILGGMIAAIAASGLPADKSKPAPQAPAPPPRKFRRPPTLPLQLSLKLVNQRDVKFRDPPELSDEHEIDLTLTTGRFADLGGPNVLVPAEYKLLCYNNLSVGPTIRVHRGRKLRIRLKNELFKIANVPIGNGPGGPPNNVAEQAGTFCTTNLHTHGLHVSPADPSDNIYLCLKPGQTHHFTYEIPTNHPSGTMWYHPHHHHSVAYQLSNGVSGALIVEGSPHDGIHDLEKIPEIAIAKEHIFVFQLYNYRVQIDANGNPLSGHAAWIDASTIYSGVQPARVGCDALDITPDDVNPDSKKTTSNQATAINGVIDPTLTIHPGEVQRWRLIHAAWDLNRQLTLVTADNADNEVPVTAKLFHEIALDGIATGCCKAKCKVEIAPGQRSDVLFQAPLLDQKDLPRTYYLKQSAADGTNSPHSLPQDPLILAKIVVTGPPKPMNLPDPTEVAKCKPYASVLDNELVGTNKSFTFAADDAAPMYTINGKIFSMQQPLQLRLDSAEEWTLGSAADKHTFHIHVNPFQIVSHTDVAKNKTTKMDCWRDTLFFTPNDVYTIRTRYLDFTGKTVFHCHILDHEDQGMMMPIELKRVGQPLPPQKICPEMKGMKALAQELHATSAPTPPLKLADVRDSMLDLSQLRGRPVVLVFFRGMDCPHCTQQLRDLVARAPQFRDRRAEIVAVSSEAIANGGEALKTLGVSPADRFHLLVDAKYSAFRSFGCLKDDDPKHGLFVIDGAGMTRAAYVGNLPFDDAGQVVASLQRLE